MLFLASGIIEKAMCCVAEKLGIAGIKTLLPYVISLIRKQKIKIISPHSLKESLHSTERYGASYMFQVFLRLKRLPKDHKIWLLVENPDTGEVWPQGFRGVDPGPMEGTWIGWVNAGSGGIRRSQAKIVAVVAPPASDLCFRYFQEVGNRTGRCVPLRRLPTDCLKNSDYVIASIPNRILPRTVEMSA